MEATRRMPQERMQQEREEPTGRAGGHRKRTQFSGFDQTGGDRLERIGGDRAEAKGPDRSREAGKDWNKIDGNRLECKELAGVKRAEWNPSQRTRFEGQDRYRRK